MYGISELSSRKRISLREVYKVTPGNVYGAHCSPDRIVFHPVRGVLLYEPTDDRYVLHYSTRDVLRVRGALATS